MGIFTERYSFRLNVVQDKNVVKDTNIAQHNPLSNFCGE